MITTTILSLLALSVLPLVASSPTLASRSDSIHVPITRRSSKNRGLDDFANAADRLRIKYHYKTVGSKQKRAGSTAAESITNVDFDSGYTGAISVGTPAQQINVILDSGSSDLWLANTQCTSCPSGTPEFDTTKSSTFAISNQPAAIQYGSGAVQGTLAQDTVSMAGFTVSQQTFLSVDVTSPEVFVGSNAGFMGLAFQSIASTGALPFWQALINNNQFSSPEMSFYLTRYNNDPNAQTEEPGGVLTLGGTNTSLYTGNIQFLAMPSSVSPSWWLLQMSSVTVQGSNVQISTGNTALTAIDTGTTIIGGPSQDVQNIWAKVPGSQALIGNMTGYYSFPCSTQVEISLSFGGNSWPISASDMNLGTVSGSIGNGQCLGGVFDLGEASITGSGNPGWIVGDTFLKNVYTVLRASPPSIGFAQLSASAGSSAAALATETALVSGTGNPLPTTVPSNSPSSSSSSGAASFRAASFRPLSASFILVSAVGVLALS